MSSCAITPSRSTPSVSEGSTQIRPATISRSQGTSGSPVGTIPYSGSASPMSASPGGTASAGQLACGAKVTRMTPSAGAAVPAATGSGLNPSCHTGGKAALIACTTRTVSSINAAGVPSAIWTVGGAAAKRTTSPPGMSWTSAPSPSPGVPYEAASACR